MAGMDNICIEMEIGHLLRALAWKLSTAESCTGGLIAHRITNIPGSSDYFDCGVVSYSNEAKIQVLGVPEDMIATHGAVSGQTAIAMAEGIRRLRKTEAGIGVTGIAGPTGGTPAKPVGLVYIAISTPGGTDFKEFLFKGEREDIKYQASQAALGMLKDVLEKAMIG